MKERIIEFKRLTDVTRTEIIALMNNPLVRRQMPLFTEAFSDHICKQFVISKEKLWIEYGYGPWAFVVDGRFAGWGGLQPEQGEPDLALVLHPSFWGLGKVLFREIVSRAFVEMGFEAITILLPLSRMRSMGLIRFGFVMDQELNVGGTRFARYRLQKKQYNVSTFTRS